jgi:DNA-binding MarR family transcriptional regulator
MLYLLFDSNELSSRDIAEKTGMSEPQVSIHLRHLNSRGLIRQHRRKMKLLSSPEANQEIESANGLITALKACHARNTPTQLLFRQATAFTHARRIEIIQQIPAAGITNELLSEKTGIPISAINRHLHKLKARNFVQETKGCFTLAVPDDPFSRALLSIINQKKNVS